MKFQKWSTRLTVGTLMTVALAGVALAASQQGTQADPLVTLSYINSKVTPAILTQVDAKIAQRENALTAKLQQAAGGSTSGGSSSASDSFSVVTLTKGQTLTTKTGCELLFRSGTATCVAESAPGLVDMTGGSTLLGGGTLVQNHLYLSTTDGRGVKATAAVTLLVRGSYTVA